jgi:glutamyl-tRNA synthetase/glutamyl-Q tRNA(Asp) synthetase
MIVSRFAPAPTGRLHLGHVVNAMYVWGLTKGVGGRVLLRIEDHDRRRSRAEFERDILDDLDWLGFIPDAPGTKAFRSGPCEGRQRDRGPFYEAALTRLREQGLVYACECSRREIASAEAVRGELRYPGTCAGKRLREGAGRGLRVRLAPSVERFDDWRHGPQEQYPSEQSGDLLVRDRDGHWTYQFAVVVDDHAQGVTLVIRGDDLLASTGRQIQLARLLGRATPPAFLHHPLIMKTSTQKLSKADHDTSVYDLRAAGWTAPDLVGRAAFMAGLTDAARPIHATEVSALVLPRFAHRLDALNHQINDQITN